MNMTLWAIMMTMLIFTVLEVQMVLKVNASNESFFSQYDYISAY
jgi:hypothetical protein